MQLTTHNLFKIKTPRENAYIYLISKFDNTSIHCIIKGYCIAMELLNAMCYVAWL